MRSAAAWPAALGVEFGRGPPQRQVDLRSQHQDGEGEPEVQRAVEEAQAQEERHERRAHRGEDLERQGGRKATLRVLIVLVGSPRRRSRGCGARPRPAEGAKRRQALEKVVEGGGEARRAAAHCRLGVALGLEAEQDHEHRDDRHGDGQDHKRGPVGRSSTQASSTSGRQRRRTAVGR